jgi:hypothetical protein
MYSYMRKGYGVKEWWVPKGYGVKEWWVPKLLKQ